MERIKIAYVITRFRSAGPINQTYYIIKNLDRSKFEAHVVSLFPEEKESKLNIYKELGVHIVQLKLSKASCILFGRKIVAKELSKISPDIVQPVGLPPYRQTLSYKKAIRLMTLRNYLFEDYPVKYGRLIGWPMALLDMIFIKSQYSKGVPFVTCSESLSKIYARKEDVRFDFIRNGVDVSKFPKRNNANRKNIRKRLGVNDGQLLLVYSGKINKRKNQEEAIEGFLKSTCCNTSVLLLLGDGELYEDLRERYSNKNIIFEGNVRNVAEYLTGADLYLSTSKSEGLPNGVLEAMAVGLPVLLSDIPQHKEVLLAAKGIGCSYKIGDVDSFARQLDSMSKKNLQEMGDIAYQCVHRNFTDKLMSQQYQDLYYRLYSKKHSK